MLNPAPHIAPDAVADSEPRTVLLIAYHFPPLRGSSGIQRTLRFAQHLPKFGWKPIILTIHPGAYEDTGNVRGNEIPPDAIVHRAFGLNAARQLSVFGRYPKMFALPDRWASWRYWAVPKALRLIKEHRVDAIWSTFPIATAHGIAMQLAARTKLPWIAEFRDPMWQSDWPPEPTANRVWRELERKIFTSADRVIFTAPSAVDMYAERFPELHRDKLRVIENGYDEETFQRAESAPVKSAGPITLLHSGIIYSSERDPTQFFAALASLRSKELITPATFRVVLRASGAEKNFSEELQRLGIADVVQIEPAIDYIAALQEMLQVDGLLVLQAANCNAQVPAKLYEYIRAKRPILALTDPAGDTARTLRNAGLGTIARLDSAADIEAALLAFVAELREGEGRSAAAHVIASCSREARAGELARLLEETLPKTKGIPA